MKKRRTMVILIFNLLFYCNLSFSQGPRPPYVSTIASPAYSISTVDGKAVFPFELTLKHAVIPVTVNGKTFRFILDTGMPLDGALLFGSEGVNALDLQYLGKSPVMGVTFALPAVEITNQMVLVMPQDSIRNRNFEDKDGIIGNSLFSRFVEAINYDSVTITLTEPQHFKYARAGRKFPLRLDRYPFLSCEAEIIGGKTIPAELVIDWGNGAAMTLNTTFHAGRQGGNAENKARERNFAVELKAASIAIDQSLPFTQACGRLVTPSRGERWRSTFNRIIPCGRLL